MQKKSVRIVLFALIVGMPAVLASVPRSNQVTNDVAVYQNLHEIRITKTKYLNFDDDIRKLSAQEKSHRTVLPVRVTTPMERVNQTPYRPGQYRRK